MYVLIIGIIIVVAALLVLVVLAQNPKGGGLSSEFGGSGSSQLMGVKKTNDLLEKLTWGFALALLVLTLSTNFFLEDQNGREFVSPNINNAQGQTTIPANTIQPEGSDGIEDLGLEESVSDSAQ